MADLDQEIAVFEAIRSDLEANQQGKWTLIRGKDLIGTFETFDTAASVAVARFGRGPYLIRQVGAPPVVIPASAMYTFHHARD
jgi:hypothetical protein